MHGHRVGDELLIAVAERLTAQMRPGDTLARLSGDEFIILCEDLAGGSDAYAIATRIGAALTPPFILSVGEMEATASIGIAFAGPAASMPEDLLDNADVAMYQAKRKGGARHQTIDLSEQHLLEDRIGLQRDLRHACGNGQLRLDYQPIVSTVDGRIMGVEALLRWAHPSRGLVPPTTLIPLAEQSSLITDIGRWVLEQACLDRHRWAGGRPTDNFAMAVNVSA